MSSRTPDAPQRQLLRIGAVNYLNSKPLIEGLPDLLCSRGELRLDYPSRLAEDLAVGRLDVALIPSIEYFRGNDYEIVSDACVAAHGPVLSVKLYSRAPWGEIRTLALDVGSRTSAALAQVLLAERHGVCPKLQPLPLEQRTEECSADAILLIGDRAILPPTESFPNTWDLGKEWFDWTGLPFVFAMWVAGRTSLESVSTVTWSTIRSHSSHFDIEDVLNQARDYGIERLTEIARREAALLGLSLPTTISYLSQNLQYHLGSAERSGLKLFYELASGMGLAPSGATMRFRTCEVM